MPRARAVSRPDSTMRAVISPSGRGWFSRLMREDRLMARVCTVRLSGFSFRASSMVRAKSFSFSNRTFSYVERMTADRIEKRSDTKPEK